MARNKNVVTITTVLIILGVLVGGYFLISAVLSEDPISFLEMRLFDEQGNLIKKSGESIVQGVPGVYFIDLTITVRNTGSQPLTCDVISLTPSAFDFALTQSPIIVPDTAPKKGAWTSDLIEVAPLESLPQPVRFEATVQCTYQRGDETVTLDSQSGYIDLFIQPDEAGAGFEVEIGTGGEPSEFCGDGSCQVDETATSCPADCAVANNVNFRTTDLSYVSGTAVGYASTCGQNLVAYGRTNGACTDHRCEDLDQDLNVPSALGTTKLWIRDVDNLCICDDGTTSGYSKRYNTGDSDASKVDTTSISFDPAKENAC